MRGEGVQLTVLLFDDPVARGWHPFSLTRPAGELLFGASLLREKLERVIGVQISAYVAAPGLDGFEEEGAPAALPEDRLPPSAARLVLSTRYLAPAREGSPLRALPANPPPGGLPLVVEGGGAVGWLLGGADPVPTPDRLANNDDRPALSLPGRLIETPWQLVSENARQIADELDDTRAWRGDPGREVLRKAQGVHLLGDRPITVESGVRVDPLVVLDSRPGPIHISHDVWVQSFTHLTGPAFIGSGSVLMGGAFEAVSCGPRCKLRGEIRNSVVLGYSNKAHDGYLGHSMLGQWVNLGALTTNSDLKNNYGSVRVGRQGGTTDTGLVKLGALLGDHVKTGIGTLLGAGTVVGAGTNLFGDGLSAKWIPPFSWGSAAEHEPYRLRPFLETVERVMARRQLSLTQGQRRSLGSAWRRAHPGLSENGG